MAVFDLNTDSVEILELTQEMNRASTCRFRIATEIAKSTGLSVRSEVRYVHSPSVGSDVVWFAGRVVPSQRVINIDSDYIEYLAADAMEWLGNNPADAVNEFYNIDRSNRVADFPGNKSTEDVLGTEFARLIGDPDTDTDHLIESISWENVGSGSDSIRNLIVRNISLKGKSWIEILDMFRNELPPLSYWLDPSSIDPTASHVRGYTLRIYDVSKISEATAVDITAARTDAADDSDTNLIDLSVREDISRSIDTLTLHGWGDMQEEYEKLTEAWGTYPNDTGAVEVLLRAKPGEPNTIQQHTGSGNWSDVNTYAGTKAWFPNLRARQAQTYMRRYQTSNDVVDLKIVIDETVSPPTWQVQEKSMDVEALMYWWYGGQIGGIAPDGINYSGVLIGNTKVVPWTNGAWDDFGDLRPADNLYPSYPSGDLTPRFSIGTPNAYEGNYIILGEPLIGQTGYHWVANASTDSNFDNFADADHFMYWSLGDDVWMAYTSKVDLSVTKTDAGLGYDKHLVLYDFRFFKYTDIEGVVLRDDSDILDDFATMLFAILSKKRIYGSVKINIDPDGLGDFAMGYAPVVENWYGNTPTTDDWVLDAIIQKRTLLNLGTKWELELGFDSPDTYVALENTKKFRRFFKAGELLGITQLDQSGKPGSDPSGAGFPPGSYPPPRGGGGIPTTGPGGFGGDDGGNPGGGGSGSGSGSGSSSASSAPSGGGSGSSSATSGAGYYHCSGGYLVPGPSSGAGGGGGG